MPGADATVLEETTISLGGAVLSSLEKVGKATSSEHKVRNEIVLVLFYTVVPGFLHLRRSLDLEHQRSATATFLTANTC